MTRQCFGLQNEGFVMEEKLDGERIQVHKRGQEFRYFSRRDHDYTVGSLRWPRGA